MNKGSKLKNSKDHRITAIALTPRHYALFPLLVPTKKTEKKNVTNNINMNINELKITKLTLNH